MKVLSRGPTRAELDALVRDVRLQHWRRRSVAALVAAALAAGSVMPAAVAQAEPGGWDGGMSSSSPSSQESNASSSSSSSSSSSDSDSSPSSPSEAADAAGPSSSSS